MLARTGTDVDYVIGLADRLFVVLDDDHGVAEIPEPCEGIEQLAVVTLVQTDGWFVEHVENTDESGPDLAGEPDSLRLTSGEGRSATCEGEIVESHVEQELHAGPDFAQHAVGDHVLSLGQLDLADCVPLHGISRGCRARDVPAPHGDRERLGLQTRRRRMPVHGTSRMYDSIDSRNESVSASEWRRWSQGMTPSYRASKVRWRPNRLL